MTSTKKKTGGGPGSNQYGPRGQPKQSTNSLQPPEPALVQQVLATTSRQQLQIATDVATLRQAASDIRNDYPGAQAVRLEWAYDKSGSEFQYVDVMDHNGQSLMADQEFGGDLEDKSYEWAADASSVALTMGQDYDRPTLAHITIDLDAIDQLDSSGPPVIDQLDVVPGADEAVTMRAKTPVA